MVRSGLPAAIGNWFVVVLSKEGREPDSLAFRDRGGNFYEYDPGTGKLHSTSWLRGWFEFSDAREGSGIVRFEAVSRERASSLIESGFGAHADARLVTARARDRFALPVGPRLAAGAREVMPTPLPAQRRAKANPLLDRADPDVVFQLTEYEFRAAVLQAGGCPLEKLLTELEVVVKDQLNTAELAVGGWRLLEPEGSHRLTTRILAAPDPYGGDRWQVLMLRKANGGQGWEFHGQRTLSLRPSRAERRAGIQLRWPVERLRLPAEQLESLKILLCNTGRRAWKADPEDSLHTVGWIKTHTDALPAESRYVYSRVGPTELTLKAGGTHELPVLLLTKKLDKIAPGKYIVEAALPALLLRSVGAELEIVDSRE